MSRFPFPPYLDGWFRAAFSHEIAPGEVQPVHWMGRDLVLFRADDGTPHLLDAHCPHLGAHLGHGGTVEGSGLRCPFHHWRFEGDGRCSDVPYARRIPPAAQVRAWEVVERNGVIFFWHHADGAPPGFEIPEVPELRPSGAWTPLVARRYRIRSHWVDMNENAVDGEHFLHVHGTPVAPRLQCESRGHELHIFTAPGDPFQVRSVDHGPGFRVVYATEPTESVIFLAATPIDESYTESIFAYTARRLPGLDADALAATMVERLDADMQQDIRIWENKVYRESPLLCDGDGPISEYRRWISRFWRQEPEPVDARRG